MKSAQESPATSLALAQLIDQLTDEMQRGVVIDWSEVARQYPQHEEQLRNLAPSLEMLKISAGATTGSTCQSRLSHVSPAALLESDLTRLGDFRLVREIGRGGMGIVYEAEQMSLHRRVALKMLPFAGLLDERRLQRFRTEVQAVALLHHPHIVPVFAVGSEREVHFFAMQYIDGLTLADVVATLRAHTRPPEALLQRNVAAAHTCSALGAPLSDAMDAAISTVRIAEVAEPTRADGAVRREVLENANLSWGHLHDRFCGAVQWIIQAAEAIDHAHQQGILHRDIKPANLMLDRQNWLWVADFGLARFRDDSPTTATGELVGTLRYMSPEQASGSKFLDERTDVYSLGATLYELLLLERMFPHDDSQRLLHAVLHEEPVAPRRIEPRLPRDLETIVFKAIAKQRSDRYRSAVELAEDLKCWLERRPIRSRRLSPVQKTARWVSRNPALAMLIALVGILVSMLGAGSIWYQSRLTITASQLMTADASLQAERHFTLRTQAMRLAAERPAEWTRQALEKLQAATQISPVEQERQELRSEAVALLSAPDIVHTATLPHQDVVHCLTFDRSGNRLAVGYNLVADEVPIEVWDPATHQLLETLRFPVDPDYVTTRGVHGDGARSLAFSRDGHWLAVGTRSGWVHLWDLTTPERRLTSWRADRTPVLRVRFVHNGDALVAACQSGLLSQWSVPDHELLQQRDFVDELTDFDFAPSKMVLCAVYKKGVAIRLSDLSDVPYSYTGAAVTVDQSPSLRYSVWGADSGRVFQLDATGNVVRELRHGSSATAHPGLIRTVTCSADGGLIATSCSEHVLNVWNAMTSELVRSFNLGTNGQIYAEFSTANVLAVTVDRETRLYRINGSQIDHRMATGVLPVITFAEHHRYGQVVTLAPDTATDDALAVRHWNSGERRDQPLYRYIRPSGERLCQAGTKRLVLTNHRMESIDVWEGRKSLMYFKVREVRDVQFDPERNELWAACANPSTENKNAIGGIRGWNLGTQVELGKWLNMQAEKARNVTEVSSLDLGKRYIVGGSHDGTVIILQRQPFELLHQINLNVGRVRSVAVTADEQLVLAGGDSGEIVLIRPTDGSIVSRIAAHNGPTESIGICRTVSYIATGSAEGELRVWWRDQELLTPLFRLPKQPGGIVRCRFSGRTTQLLTLARGDTAVHGWNIGQLRRELQSLGLGW